MITREGTQDAATLSEVREYALLRMSKADTVLDLGGCIGAFGRLAADTGASVVAVEPEPSNAAVYRLNVPEAEVLEFAVSSNAGERALWLGSTNSHALGERRGRTEHIVVATITLPELIAIYHRW